MLQPSIVNKNTEGNAHLPSHEKNLYVYVDRHVFYTVILETLENWIIQQFLELLFWKNIYSCAGTEIATHLYYSTRKRSPAVIPQLLP